MSREAQPQLRRRLSTFELTATGVGIILGAGIFVLIGSAAGLAGNGVWLPFALGAVAATFTGLSYAELASAYPRSAAAFEYSSRAFGHRVGFMTGWSMLFAAVIQVSAVSIGFAGYFADITGAPTLPVVLGVIAASCVILWLGVRESVWMGVAFALIEVVGLFLAISVSLRFIGDVSYFEFSGGFPGVMEATALLFFAFLGFEQMANLAEETRDPGRSLPRAFIMAVAITSALYMLVAITAVSAVDWRELAESDAPLALVVETATGTELSTVLSVTALFATANTVLFGLLAASRQLYGMARARALPAVFERVASRRGTPWAAIAAVCIGAFAFSLAGEAGQVAQMSNAAVLMAFVIVNASLVRIRLAGSEANTGFKTPGRVGRVPVVPVLGATTALIVLAYTGAVPLLLATGLLASAILIDVVFRRATSRPVDKMAGQPAGPDQPL